MTTEEHTDDDEAAPWDLLANALGSLGDLEEDEESLDIQEDFGQASSDPDDPFYKIPLEKAGNLLRIRKAASDLKDGTITREKYLVLIRPFIQPLENGLELLDSKTVQAQIDELPEDQKPLFDWTYNNLVDLLEGLQIMHGYRESGEMADVDEGLALVEQALTQLDQIQDEAIEIGRDEKLQEELEEL